MSAPSLPSQKLVRLKNIRNVGAVALVLSLTFSWITVWIAQRTIEKLEANPVIAKEDILSEIPNLLAILFALGLIVLISGMTTLVSIVLVMIKSKVPKK
ncbi:MAG: hypothetical protein OSA93_06880 [Akkermansiaceae bacterium]|nr:hypothetical protein [Akkermansiaceae bacterium]